MSDDITEWHHLRYPRGQRRKLFYFRVINFNKYWLVYHYKTIYEIAGLFTSMPVRFQLGRREKNPRPLEQCELHVVLEESFEIPKRIRRISHKEIPIYVTPEPHLLKVMSENPTLVKLIIGSVFLIMLAYIAIDTWILYKCNFRFSFVCEYVRIASIGITWQRRKYTCTPIPPLAATSSIHCFLASYIVVVFHKRPLINDFRASS